MAIGQGVSFDWQMFETQDSGGAPTAVTDLFILVADTGNDGFEVFTGDIGNAMNASQLGTPTFLDGAGGDDLILWRQSGGTSSGTPGFLAESISVALGTYGSATWDVNDRLAAVWFPGLTTATTTLTGGESYGIFSPGPNGPKGTDSAGLPAGSNTLSNSGGSAWLTPNGASDYALYGFSDANFILGGDTPIPSNFLQATGVVPEPSTYALILGLAVLIPVVILHGRRMRAQEEEE